MMCNEVRYFERDAPFVEAFGTQLEDVGGLRTRFATLQARGEDARLAETTRHAVHAALVDANGAPRSDALAVRDLSIAWPFDEQGRRRADATLVPFPYAALPRDDRRSLGLVGNESGTLMEPVATALRHTALVIEKNCNVGGSTALNTTFIRRELARNPNTPLLIFSTRIAHADEQFATAERIFGDLAPALKCYHRRKEDTGAHQHCSEATQLIISPETCALGALGTLGSLLRFKGGILVLDVRPPPSLFHLTPPAPLVVRSAL